MNYIEKIEEALEKIGMKKERHTNGDQESVRIKVGSDENSFVTVYIIPDEKLERIQFFVPLIKKFSNDEYEKIVDFIMDYNILDAVFGSLVLIKIEPNFYLGYTYSICLSRGEEEVTLNHFEINELLGYISFLVKDVKNELLKV